MILVFGSLNMDLVVRVPTLPRPGETIVCQDYVARPGGKGANQVVAAARAGAEAHMYGLVGTDAFGQALVDNLTANGVSAEGVGRSDRPTGVAFICVDDAGENFIAVAAGANADAEATLVPEAALDLGGVTVLMQMEVPHDQNWSLIRHAREVGALTILNLAPAAPIPTSALHDLDILVVNRVEAEGVASILGLPAGQAPPALARAIADATEVTCVLTLGAEGAIAADRDAIWGVGTLPVDVVDTTGAGDAFVGALASALDRRLGLPDALHRAAVASGLACQSLGAQSSVPRADEIEARVGDLASPRRLDLAR